MPAASIRIDRFGGARPRMDSRALNEHEAVIAENCRLWSGKLGAWRKPTSIFPASHNYLLWSNQFQQGVWTQTGLSDVLVNATNAPDGTLTADKLRESAVNTTHNVSQVIAKPAVADYWCGSCSGKIAERNFMVVQMESGGGADFARAIINLTTGAITASATGGAFSDATFTPVAETNGFWRLHVVAKTTVAATITLRVGASTDGIVFSYLGTLNSGIYVDGASLRKSNKVGPYRETLGAALSAEPTSIYGFRDLYWFVANEVRHYARAPIASDTVETTYYTRASGDPRVTYSPLAEDPTGSGDLPRGSFSMGLPVPTNAPGAVLASSSGNISAASAIVVSAGANILQSYTIGPGAVDGTTVRVRAHLKVTLATTTAHRAAVFFDIQRDGIILAKTEVSVEFDLDPVVGDTQVAEYTFEIDDDAPAGNKTWTVSVNANVVGAGAMTKTYANTGGSVRYLKTLISSAGHNRVVGDLVKVAGVLGMEAINVESVNVLEVPNANQFYIDVDSLAQVYTSGGTWTAVYDDEDISDTAYVFTWLSQIGGKILEGPPSAASNIVAKGDGQTVNLSAIDTIAPADGGNYNFFAKRIYRTNVRTDLGANYQFVAEIAVGQNNYVDTIRDIALGEVMPSKTWIKPPNDMHGLIEHTNGVLAGISGKEICFCEPFQPHAWPVSFRLACFSVPIALCSLGASIAVVTKGKPHIINGTVPGQMEMVRVDAAQPCVSELGVVDMGYSCVYPGDDGLMSLSSGGMVLVTEATHTREEWQKLNPSTIRGAEFDGRYVGSYTKPDGTKGGFILDPRDPLGTFTTLPFGFSALWTDPDDGTLYVVYDEYVASWDSGATWFDYRWRSKTFDLHAPVNFAVGKLEASDYPVTLEVYSNPDPTTIEDSGGGPQLELVDTFEVMDAKPFVMSGDYSGSLYELEARGNGAGKLKRLVIATSIEGLNA